MKSLSILAGLTGLVAAAQTPQAILDNSAQVSRVPTSLESAVMGRRILALTKLATFSTVFPGSSSSAADQYDDAETLQKQPEGLGGVPVGLMDYIADCEDDGNPTVLAIKIGTSFRNVRAGSNLTISMRWIPTYPPSKRISFLSRLSAYVPFLSGHCPYNTPPESRDSPDAVPYSAANLPRFSLFGYMEAIGGAQSALDQLSACYTRKHQDAKYWLPGNRIHESEWMRFVVTGVYWVGGFGDRAYIGWIPVEEWKSVTRDQWGAITLPGEKKGWSEWSIDASGEL
ncbi:hypothetical protein HIM_04919 [Hirsutella minnesotensis 3608]|uniref:CREG-like beta-barrel domain-containing protein n=1 Tax=Hirsutella minnesotensis 3608 TaxID=1043627 RepID=A0A0F8A109_9HYPO|nr:hypothetical protein HIM_04919 [Hirsutella minnesotensis 3608]